MPEKKDPMQHNQPGQKTSTGVGDKSQPKQQPAPATKVGDQAKSTGNPEGQPGTGGASPHPGNTGGAGK